MIFKRKIQKNIENYLFKGKILVVYGARQVGKTTLVKSILKKYSSEEGYFNCENIRTKQQLESLSPESTKTFLGNSKIIVLDEAQKIENIGLVLKQLIDTFPDIQIIATGSSSFDLANKINEPLTGRAIEFIIYPISVSEFSAGKNNDYLQENLERLMIYGSYPEILNSDQKMAQKLIEQISGQYLYKDILELENIRKSKVLINLLELLALQLGSEVSIHELSTKLEINTKTIAIVIVFVALIKPFSTHF